MVFMPRRPMHSGKIKYNILFCWRKRQTSDRFPYITFYKNRLQCLPVFYSRLIILNNRIWRTRLNYVKIVNLCLRISLFNQIRKMGTNKAGTTRNNVIHFNSFNFVLLLPAQKIKSIYQSQEQHQIHAFLNIHYAHAYLPLPF